LSHLAITELPLAGLRLVQRKRLGDARGFLSRLYCADELAGAGWLRPVVQVNHSGTARQGTVRGLHFQVPPYAEMKLVSCIRGRIFDVAVDLRSGSSTFACWHGEVLDAEAGDAMLLPEGFAHGFQALTDTVELVYCHSQVYNAAAEGGFDPLDARLAIAWPLPVVELSERDRALPHLGSDFKGFEL
jgi:dTDP-4-dehydrorhamnose 3,5-epimerase